MEISQSRYQELGKQSKAEALDPDMLEQVDDDLWEYQCGQCQKVSDLDQLIPGKLIECSGCSKIYTVENLN